MMKPLKKWLGFMILAVFMPFCHGYVTYGFLRWHGAEATLSATIGVILAIIVSASIGITLWDDEGGAQ